MAVDINLMRVQARPPDRNLWVQPAHYTFYPVFTSCVAFGRCPEDKEAAHSFDLLHRFSTQCFVDLNCDGKTFAVLHFVVQLPWQRADEENCLKSFSHFRSDAG